MKGHFDENGELKIDVYEHMKDEVKDGKKLVGAKRLIDMEKNDSEQLSKLFFVRNGEVICTDPDKVEGILYKAS